MTRIWDLPTRLFHWGLAVAVTVSLYTGLRANGDMDVHLLSGYVVLALLIFRIAWGFLGATYARFAQFMVAPTAAVAYLKKFRSAAAHAGHNPAGAWAVLLMLLALSAQALTGLFTTDDVFVEGPLRHLATEATNNALSAFHHRNAFVVVALIALHLSALTAHRVLRRDGLMLAMLRGDKLTSAAPTTYRRWVAIALGAGSVALVYGTVHWL